MTTRAREVEAWLRTEETRYRKANTALRVVLSLRDEYTECTPATET